MSNIKKSNNPIPISIRAKKKLSDALAEIMTEKSFDKIKIKDVVERAGLTRQTFYINFPSLEAVAEYKIGEHIEKMLEFVRSENMTNRDDFMWFYLRYWQQNSDYLKLLIRDDFIKYLTKQSTEYFKALNIIRLGDDELGELEYDYAYAFLSGAMTSLLVFWIDKGPTIDARHLSKTVAKIITGEALSEIYQNKLPADSEKSELHENDG